MKTVVELNKVTFGYPHDENQALHDFDLSIAPGEAIYCAGLSGGGKTTLLRLLNGLAWEHYGGRLTGSVSINGANPMNKSLKTLAREVSTLFQNPDNQFFALTPRDDFLLTLECRGLGQAEACRQLEFWAEKFKLGDILDRRVDRLSSGEKQKVILAETLALSPSLLLLDEPTANLDPAAARELAGNLRQARAEGLAMLIVDHRRHWLGPWVDRALILDQGRLVWEGRFERLDDPALSEKWGLRRPGKRPGDPPPAGRDHDPPGEEIEVRNLSFAYPRGPALFNDFSCFLPTGSVSALVGPNGSGKTSLLRLVSGLSAPESGEIIFQNQPLKSSARLSLSSLAMQNADRQLVMKSVAAELGEAWPRGRRNRDKISAELESWGLGHLASRHPQSLSGGEKQKLVLACALARDSRFLALDEPTSGLDGRNMALVAEAVKKAAAASRALLLATHDQELIEQAADKTISLL